MAKFYTVADVCAAKLCDKSTVSRIAKNGNIGTRAGKMLLFSSAEFKEICNLVKKVGCPKFVAGNDLWRQRKTLGK